MDMSGNGYMGFSGMLPRRRCVTTAMELQEQSKAAINNRWSDVEMTHMLARFEDRQLSGESDITPKWTDPIYDTVSAELSRLGYPRTAAQIRDQWNYLKKKYSRVRRGIQLLSNSSPMFQKYFETVERLLQREMRAKEQQAQEATNMDAEQPLVVCITTPDIKQEMTSTVPTGTAASALAELTTGNGQTAHFWSEEETDVLLQCIEQYQFLNRNFDLDKLNIPQAYFEKIERKMRNAGLMKTVTQTRDRWAYLKKHYRNVRARHAANGHATDIWRFYDRVDRLLRPVPTGEEYQPNRAVGANSHNGSDSSSEASRGEDNGPDVQDDDLTEEDMEAEDMEPEGSQTQWLQNHSDRTWTVKETANLLQTLSRNSPFMNKRWGLITPVVVKIQEQLSREGYQRDVTQIRSRWHHLKKHYHRLVDKGLSPKAAQRKWRYFDVVGKLLCDSVMANSAESDRRGADAAYVDTPEPPRTVSNQSAVSEASGSSSTGRTRHERMSASASATKLTSSMTRSACNDKGSAASSSKGLETNIPLVCDSAVSGSGRRYENDSSASTSNGGEVASSGSRDFYMDFCKQQMEFMQQSHAQQLSWFKSQMEINQQNHVQQQAWFHEQMVMQRQKEEEMIKRQFEQSKMMTESIVYRLFDGMCQLADNIFSKSMVQPAVMPSGGIRKTDAMAQLALTATDPSSPARCVVPPVSLDSLSPTSGSGEGERNVDCVTPVGASPTQVLQITQPFSLMDTSKSKEDQ